MKVINGNQIMKILYIYRDYKGRRKKYGEMMERCGHKVIYIKLLEKKIKNQITKKDLKKYDFDIIWIQAPSYMYYKVISDEAIDYAKSCGKILVMYNTIIPDFPYMENMEVWNKFDFLFIHYKDMANDLKEAGVNCYYSPLAFYPSQYRKNTNANKQVA